MLHLNFPLDRREPALKDFECYKEENNKLTAKQNKKRRTIMRKLIGCVSAGALAVLLTGCVGPMGVAGGAYGYVYTDVSGPVLATSNAGCSRW